MTGTLNQERARKYQDIIGKYAYMGMSAYLDSTMAAAFEESWKQAETMAVQKGADQLGMRVDDGKQVSREWNNGRALGRDSKDEATVGTERNGYMGPDYAREFQSFLEKYQTLPAPPDTGIDGVYGPHVAEDVRKEAPKTVKKEGTRLRKFRLHGIRS